MKMKAKFLVVFLISLPAFQFILNFGFPVYAQTENQPPDVFFGIDVAYDNQTEFEALVNEVSAYTNLLVIGCTGITHNVVRLDEVCQYVYDRGLYFIVYKHPPPNDEIDQAQWVADAKERWGDRFLGIYLVDESGGRQIDVDDYRFVNEADNYTDAADKYVETLDEVLKTYTEDVMTHRVLQLVQAQYRKDKLISILVHQPGWV